MFFGNLDIVRILDLFSGNQLVLNHNYPGFLAGVALVYVYILWMRYDFNRFVLILLGLILSAGTLLSTSRSAFLAIFLIFILLNIFEKDLRANLRTIFLTGFAIISLIVGIFMIYEFGILSKNYKEFSGKFYYRLYEEPLEAFGAEEAGFNPYTGERLGGSVKFRSEKWAKDLDKFFNKDIPTQTLGLGPGGYSEISEKVYRTSGNVRYQLATHNGYLIIMFERGYFGLILYLIILASLSLKYFKITSQNPIKMPVLYLILTVAIYSFGQNSELTSRFMYLAFGGLLSNLNHDYIEIEET
jgi:O-antigen ligase